MFKNMFDLKLYFKDIDCVDNGSEITKIDDYANNHYQTKLLPVINYKKNEFIIGDMFINERTKSIYIFSFLTDKSLGAIKKIGFYYIKDYKTFLNTYNFNVNYFIDLDLGYSTDTFDFFTLNGVKNLDELIKIGNIILLDTKTISSNFINFHDSLVSYIEPRIEHLKEKIGRINDIIILIKENDPSRYNYNGYNSYYINSLNPATIFEENFKFLPSIYIEDKSSNTGFISVYNQISILRDKYVKDKNVNIKYMTSFDKETFESKILLGNDNEEVNYKYISESSSKYKELREDNQDEYLKQLLYFL